MTYLSNTFLTLFVLPFLLAAEPLALPDDFGSPVAHLDVVVRLRVVDAQLLAHAQVNGGPLEGLAGRVRRRQTLLSTTTT